jgi:hypothetical protein
MELQKEYQMDVRAIDVLKRIISDIENRKVVDFNAEKIPIGFTTQYGGEWEWKVSVIFHDGD